MPANTFGEAFRVTTFGESHGGVVGAVVDGCPAGIELAESDLQPELDRRRPGQSAVSTERNETDTVTIASGVHEGRTTGSPILLQVPNRDARPEDYAALADVYRPSHADFTYERKFGHRDPRGGGRSSARETVARVAAGAIAQKILRERFGTKFLAHVDEIGGIVSERRAAESLTREAIEANMVRCPDPEAATRMIEAIEAARTAGDSLGGVIRGVVRGVPIGLGEPVFDKLPALLAHAMMSINATKGFEIGEGFAAARSSGRVHNDPFTVAEGGEIIPESNRAGGTLGGISTGRPLDFRVAFKPTATVRAEQSTVTTSGEAVTLRAAGRHDPCVVPRAVAIVDAMAALVLVDLSLRDRARRSDPA